MEIINKFKVSLAEHNIVYEPLTINGKTYEFYFKERNLCLFIVNEEEYNEKTIDKKYFSDLLAKFRERGIDLIMVYSIIFKQKYDIVFNRLLYKLKKSATTVYARKCIIKEPTYAESKDFLVKYHYQGNIMSKIRVGLYYENSLIALCVFSKPRYNKSYEYEIGRFVVKFGYNIPGNFGKMMSYFIEKYNPKSILTYHERTFCADNTCYEKIGFKFLENSAEGFYWWTKNYRGQGESITNRRKWWKNTLSERLDVFDPNISAHNNMRNNGFTKIFEMGQAVFVWHAPENK